jgi:hypothetical protein
MRSVPPADPGGVDSARSSGSDQRGLEDGDVEATNVLKAVCFRSMFLSIADSDSDPVLQLNAITDQSLPGEVIKKWNNFKKRPRIPGLWRRI